ncbi:YajG family lipoprotein [Rickettsiales bacterium]|nr:YajG family lipoprotein [Rickettsiales bacterium]
MKIILIVILTFFLTACGKSKVEIIALNPNIQSSITKTEKIWDVFDRKINILIIDDRKNKFKIKGLEKYQKDKIIYLEDGKMIYLDEVIGYKKYNKDEMTYLALNQNIMPILRTELSKGLRDKGFKIVGDNYDRILTIILEDLSYITKEDGFFTESKGYLKLRVKSGLYEKLYEITIEDEEFWKISLEEDKEEINELIRDAIISILNNKKLILMLQG